jgi:hypothetical protein
VITAFRLGARNDCNPYAAKLGATKASPAGRFSFQKMGSVWIGFSFLAGKGSSEMRAAVGADSFSNLAKAMLTANEDAAIRVFGAALQSHQDPTIRACGQILSDQRKLVETTAAPQTVAA